jgi:PKHD-type hydroxylase
MRYISRRGRPRESNPDCFVRQMSGCVCSFNSGVLKAGSMILYPASSQVTLITRDERVASFFWIQSMVRDDGERTLLFDLDSAIQRVAAESATNPAAVQLTGVYHNLLRRWAEV